MQRRRWWPRNSLTASCDGLEGVSTTDITSNEHCTKADSSTTDAVITVPAIPCGSPAQPYHLQHASDNSDWQTALLQQLLPKCISSPAQQKSFQSCQAKPAVTIPEAAVLPCCRMPPSRSNPTADSDPQMQCVGIFLDALSTAGLLSWAPPKHSRLIGDHVALQQKLSWQQLDRFDLGRPVSLRVVAATENVTIQVTQC